MAEVTAAAIYARISSDQEGTGAGVARQLADCRALAKSLGWAVTEEYVDNDVSAYSGRKRPEYERMLGDIEAGVVDAVLVYHLDRLTRRPKELEHFLDTLDAAKVTNVRFVVGDMDIGTGDGLLVARIQAAVAANESATKSRRIKRKMDEVAAQGRPHGGSVRPFGYEPDRITVRRSEAKIIREVVTRFLAGESLRSLTLWLNDHDIATSTGGTWDSSGLRSLVKSPRLAGLRALRGSVVGPAVWKPILTKEEHDRVLARLEELSMSGRRPARRYVLSGMLRCHKCGGRLFSAARATTRRYVCMSGPDHGGCGGTTVVAASTEALIADAVLYRLDTPELAAALIGSRSTSEEVSRLADDIAADREQLDELATLYADKKIPASEWLTTRNRIEDRKKLSERRLAQLTNTTALSGLVGNGAALRTQWSDLTLDRQAAIIGAVLDHAVIGAGKSGARGLDPNRVTPIWRL